jgi:UDP-N-acetylmuramoyl-L-alanyl-D-glutamate--2,6-diaminopimelate ligase
MGKAVEELADLGIITSDNPRTEDPDAIIGQICNGIQQQQKFMIEPDRAKAIELAIREARPGDVVLIAGKGHENYQIFGKEKRHFSDAECALAALGRRCGTSF